MKPTMLLLVAVSATLAACSSVPAESVDVSVAEARVCQREIPTGSNRPKTRCRTSEEAENDRQVANQMRDTVRPPGVHPGIAQDPAGR